MTRVVRIFTGVGHRSRVFLESYGRLAILAGRAFAAFRRIPRFLPQVGQQYWAVGVQSIPLIIAASLFMGLVVGVQIGTQIEQGTPPWIEAGVMLRVILIEMGPVIIGVIMAGRVGSGIASELGTMKVSEQIDALRTMGIDPVEYLVMPRLFAALVALPVLTVMGDALALLSGFISAHFTINLTWAGFVKGMRFSFVQTDVWTSLIKSLLIGILIAIFGCFFGLEARFGARGVGRATMLAVIWSSFGIIVIDYILSAVLYYVW